MKTTKFIALAGLALLTLGGPIRAQESKKGEDVDPFSLNSKAGPKKAEAPKLIRTQIEYIEMKHTTLTDLMSDKKIKNDVMLRATLKEFVRKGEAKIAETQMVVSRSGQKAVTESIEEFIYPTEYEPAMLPDKITVTGERLTKDVPLEDFATGPTPTAFETRNLGTTLEVEATLAPGGKTIDLRFAPELVRHVRNQVWSEWTDKHGKSDIQMPVMYSMRTSTGVLVTDGEYRMVSAQSPMGEDGYPDFERKVMLFVKCDVLTVGR